MAPSTLPAAEALVLHDLVTPTAHGIASRILAKTSGGNVTLSLSPPVMALMAANRAAPPGNTPTMAPTRAGSTWAAASAVPTSPGVAPRARASAEEARLSTTVAQVMKTALTAAREITMTITTRSTWRSRSI